MPSSEFKGAKNLHEKYYYRHLIPITLISFCIIRDENQIFKLVYKIWIYSLVRRLHPTEMFVKRFAMQTAFFQNISNYV
jgi:hypothetical protein